MYTTWESRWSITKFHRWELQPLQPKFMRKNYHATGSSDILDTQEKISQHPVIFREARCHAGPFSCCHWRRANAGFRCVSQGGCWEEPPTFLEQRFRSFIPPKFEITWIPEIGNIQQLSILLQLGDGSINAMIYTTLAPSYNLKSNAWVSVLPFFLYVGSVSSSAWRYLDIACL